MSTSASSVLISWNGNEQSRVVSVVSLGCRNDRLKPRQRPGLSNWRKGSQSQTRVSTRRASGPLAIRVAAVVEHRDGRKERLPLGVALLSYIHTVGANDRHQQLCTVRRELCRCMPKTHAAVLLRYVSWALHQLLVCALSSAVVVSAAEAAACEDKATESTSASFLVFASS